MDYQKAVDGKFVLLQEKMKRLSVTSLNIYPLSYNRVKLLIGNSTIVLSYDQMDDLLLNDKEAHNYTLNQKRLGRG